MREVTIEAFGKAIRVADRFVFTLGLTESWWNKIDGYEYPSCPGTISGQFDPSKHEFRNLDFHAVIDGMEETIELMRSANPKIRFILTVSPVPLTATNSGNHVLVATMESKSILRTAAGQLAKYHADVAYFPSYEIINSPVTRGIFFGPNIRSVSPMGVDFVMSHFFGEITDKGLKSPKVEPKASTPVKSAVSTKLNNDVICEEELLICFSATIIMNHVPTNYSVSQLG